MHTTWEQDGLLFGTLDDKTCEEGGTWVVGDRFKPDEPGYSKALMLETWIARRDKYEPGSDPFKDRVDSRLWEYVITMCGALVALKKIFEGAVAERITLSQGEVVECGPDQLRAWELPPGQEEARGSTILWDGVGPFFLLEEGLGRKCDDFFCFNSWTDTTAVELLHRPFTDYRFRFKYVEVFGGALVCHFKGETQELQSGDHVYVKAETDVRFEAPSSEACGTVLYYE